MAYLNFNPQTDIEKLKVLLLADQPPKNIELLNDWLFKADLPILKKYLTEWIEQCRGGAIVSSDTHHEAYMEIMKEEGVPMFAGGGAVTVGSVKDFWNSIDLTKLPDTVQVFIKEQLMDPPANFNFDDPTFLETREMIENYIAAQKADDLMPTAPHVDPTDREEKEYEEIEGIESDNAPERTTFITPQQEAQFDDLGRLQEIKKQAEIAQQHIKKPVYIFKHIDGSYFYSADKAAGEKLLLEIPYASENASENAELQVLKDEVANLEPALQYLKGADKKAVKAKIESIKAALEILGGEEFAKGGKITTNASENIISIKVADDTAIRIPLPGSPQNHQLSPSSFTYQGEHYNEELDDFIAANGLKVISSENGKRADAGGGRFAAVYKLSDNGKYESAADFIDALENVVYSADTKVFETKGDKTEFKTGGAIEQTQMDKIALSKLTEYSSKLFDIVTDKLPAWVLAKISKAELIVASVKHDLEAKHPDLFEKGGETAQTTKMMLKHINHYSGALAKNLSKIKLEPWQSSNLFVAGDYLDSVYHYLDYQTKPKLAKGGGIEAPSNDRMYNFLKDDLAKLETAISDNDKEEVERFFSYWGQHLPKLKKETPQRYRGISNDRMYNFLKDDLSKLEKAISESDKEEVERFFSYWGQHLDAVKLANGGLVKVVGKKDGQLVEISELPMELEDAKRWITQQGVEKHYTQVETVPYHGNKPAHKFAEGGQLQKIEDYKGYTIWSDGGAICVTETGDSEHRFYVGVDDSKDSGARKFSDNANNVETAKAYINWKAEIKISKEDTDLILKNPNDLTNAELKRVMAIPTNLKFKIQLANGFKAYEAKEGSETFIIMAKDKADADAQAVAWNATVIGLAKNYKP